MGLKEGPLPEPPGNQRDSHRHEASVRFGPAQVAAFLAGPPNMGVGRTLLGDAATSGAPSLPHVTSMSTGAFCRSCGARSACLH